MRCAANSSYPHYALATTKGSEAPSSSAEYTKPAAQLSPTPSLSCGMPTHCHAPLQESKHPDDKTHSEGHPHRAAATITNPTSNDPPKVPAAQCHSLSPPYPNALSCRSRPYGPLTPEHTAPPRDSPPFGGPTHHHHHHHRHARQSPLGVESSSSSPSPASSISAPSTSHTTLGPSGPSTWAHATASSRAMELAGGVNSELQAITRPHHSPHPNNATVPPSSLWAGNDVAPPPAYQGRTGVEVSQPPMYRMSHTAHPPHSTGMQSSGAGGHHAIPGGRAEPNVRPPASGAAGGSGNGSTSTQPPPPPQGSPMKRNHPSNYWEAPLHSGGSSQGRGSQSGHPNDTTHLGTARSHVYSYHQSNNSNLVMQLAQRLPRAPSVRSAGEENTRMSSVLVGTTRRGGRQDTSVAATPQPPSPSRREGSNRTVGPAPPACSTNSPHPLPAPQCPPSSGPSVPTVPPHRAPAPAASTTTTAVKEPSRGVVYAHWGARGGPSCIVSQLAAAVTSTAPPGYGVSAVAGILTGNHLASGGPSSEPVVAAPALQTVPKRFTPEQQREAMTCAREQEPHLRYPNVEFLSSQLNGGSTEEMRRRLEQRRKQILYGKGTSGYWHYRRIVPLVGDREFHNPAHPMTPRAELDSSKRAFDKVLNAWRRQLHKWDAFGEEGEKDASAQGSVSEEECKASEPLVFLGVATLRDLGLSDPCEKPYDPKEHHLHPTPSAEGALLTRVPSTTAETSPVQHQVVSGRAREAGSSREWGAAPLSSLLPPSETETLISIAQDATNPDDGNSVIPIPIPITAAPTVSRPVSASPAQRPPSQPGNGVPVHQHHIRSTSRSPNELQPPCPPSGPHHTYPPHGYNPPSSLQEWHSFPLGYPDPLLESSVGGRRISPDDDGALSAKAWRRRGSPGAANIISNPSGISVGMSDTTTTTTTNTNNNNNMSPNYNVSYSNRHTPGNGDPHGGYGGHNTVRRSSAGNPANPGNPSYGSNESPGFLTQSNNSNGNYINTTNNNHNSLYPIRHSPQFGPNPHHSSAPHLYHGVNPAPRSSVVSRSRSGGPGGGNGRPNSTGSLVFQLNADALALDSGRKTSSTSQFMLVDGDFFGGWGDDTSRSATTIPGGATGYGGPSPYHTTTPSPVLGYPPHPNSNASCGHHHIHAGASGSAMYGGGYMGNGSNSLISGTPGGNTHHNGFHVVSHASTLPAAVSTSTVSAGCSAGTSPIKGSASPPHPPASYPTTNPSPTHPHNPTPRTTLGAPCPHSYSAATSSLPLRSHPSSAAPEREPPQLCSSSGLLHTSGPRGGGSRGRRHAPHPLHLLDPTSSAQPSAVGALLYSSPRHRGK